MAFSIWSEPSGHKTFAIWGMLHKIEGFMSKGDYNTLIALVTTNFQEASIQHYSILAELIENYFRLASWKRP